MATARRRPRSSQPRLPLPIPDSASPRRHGTASRRRPAPDWRIDEHTRRIGRQGIADARAQLVASIRHAGPGPGEAPPSSDRAA